MAKEELVRSLAEAIVDALRDYVGEHDRKDAKEIVIRVIGDGWNAKNARTMNG